MSAGSGRQKELDTRIAQLELELLELKRERNRLSPISRLPADVLAIILHFSLRKIQYDRKWARKPDFVELCHVCHVWRECALAYPRLWTLFQIRLHSKPDPWQFQLKPSQQAPLDVEYCGSSLEDPNIDTICKIFGDNAVATRIRCLELHIRDNGLLRLLERVVHPESDLEELSIHCRYGRDIALEDVLHTRMAKLRRLEVSDYTLPWTSPVLASPNLTELIMGSIDERSCHITEYYITHFLSFLQHSPGLEALALRFPYTQSFEAEPDTVWAPVKLHSLRTLTIEAFDYQPLTLLLPLLHFDANVVSVNLDLRFIYEAEQITALLSAVATAFSHLSSPEQVWLTAAQGTSSGGGMKGWTGAASAGKGSDAGPASAGRWIKFNVQRTIIVGGTPRFLLASPADLNLDWWFSSVRTVAIHDIDATPDFWLMLAALPSIEDLEVVLPAVKGGGHRSFYDVLSGGGLRSGSPRGGDHYIPFPALRTLQIWNQHNHRYAEYQLTVLACTREALETRQNVCEDQPCGGKHSYLQEVAFLNCTGDASHEELEILLSVSGRVVWMCAREKGGSERCEEVIEVVREGLV